MLDVFKSLIANQFEAVFCTLHACIERCPISVWSAPVGNLAFCQVAFHTLFFADIYLGENEAALRLQPFHRDNACFFAGYEELEDRAPVILYDRLSIYNYLDHCRKKAATVIAAETADSLTGRTGFERRNFSRAELHIYNIRHIQHHAAQLSLRLRLDSNISIPWFGSGWHKAACDKVGN